jgi:hypothetical protein
MPKNEPSDEKGKTFTVTVHSDPGRRKFYVQWSAVRFHRGIVKDTSVTAPVSCGLHHSAFHLGLVNQSRNSQRVSWQPSQREASKLVTSSCVTQNNEAYIPTYPWRKDEGLELWEVSNYNKRIPNRLLRMCCVVSGLCDVLVTHSDESYRVCLFLCVI